jgi:hypothetical protein
VAHTTTMALSAHRGCATRSSASAGVSRIRSVSAVSTWSGAAGAVPSDASHHARESSYDHACETCARSAKARSIRPAAARWRNARCVGRSPPFCPTSTRQPVEDTP